MFVTNLVHFARVLRASGLPIGTGRILEAIRAVSVVGLDSREDFYWTLHAVFVNHPRQRLIFNQAFHVFWRNPRVLERAMSLLLPKLRVPQNMKSNQELARRLSESLYPTDSNQELVRDVNPQLDLRASLTYSDQEKFQEVDFESMSRDELEQAKRAIAKIRVLFKELPTRRYRVHNRGQLLDMRKTLQRSLRNMGETVSLIKKKKATKQPPVVLLCDISGSMSEYSRMMLHFFHLLSMSRNQVSCFVFGTRLTNITRQLKHRDVDYALNKVSEQVEDWHGGTRIGECLAEFNRNWIRRLPLHSSIVILVSDGLERSESGNLEQHIAMLHRSCRRLVWLNPLLRYEEFEPKVSGIRAILPHVDEFRSVHNLKSLDALAQSLTMCDGRNSHLLVQHRKDWRKRLRATSNPVRDKFDFAVSTSQ